MTQEDVPAIMSIELAAYPFPWTVGIFRDCLRVGYPGWVLERDGVIVAYAVASHGAGEGHLLNLCVTPALQRQGLALVLLERVVRDVRTLECNQLFLEVRESNLSAIKLYLRFGFSEIGRRRKYYPAENGREDAMVLMYDLTQTALPR